MKINRGYYMAAREYEFRYFQHEKIKFVSPSGHVMFCLFYRYWWNSYIKHNFFFHFRNSETVHPRKHATDAIHWISSDNPPKISHYKITKIVHALWLAERSVCMRVCQHGCDVKMFCFQVLITQARIWKSFWVQNSTSLLYLSIPSSAETWKIVTNKLCQFCFRAKSKTSWRHNHVYILSCKHSSQPIRARGLF